MSCRGSEYYPTVSTKLALGVNVRPVEYVRISIHSVENEAFVIETGGDVQGQFQAALEAIRGQKLGCDIPVPPAPSGKKIDFNLVQVNIKDSTGAATPINNVGTVMGCDPTTGGFYYDIHPDAGTPGRILLCPASCTVAQQAGEVSVELSCDAIIQ